MPNYKAIIMTASKNANGTVFSKEVIEGIVKELKEQIEHGDNTNVKI